MCVSWGKHAAPHGELRVWVLTCTGNMSLKHEASRSMHTSILVRFRLPCNDHKTLARTANPSRSRNFTVEAYSVYIVLALDFSKILV